MTVKKKLIVSNILMIVIPVLLALLFVIVSFKTVGNRYWESMEEMYDDKSGIYSAQSILFAYKNEIRDRSDLEYQKSEDGRTKVSLEKTNVMVSLEQELQDLGYHFRIRLDEETLWSTITHEDEERMEEYFEEDYDNLGLLTLSEKDLSIVKNTFEHDGKIFELAAVHTQSEDQPVSSESYFRKYIMTFILFFALFIAMAVMLVNASLSGWIVRSIMRPLNILKDGTRRIADGDLEWELDYHNKDEFGEVCGEFDRMRGHLRESVETRIQYEQYRRELIAGISHDLRTPLTSIKGYTEGLQDGIADTPEKQKRYYEAIHVRAMDMEALVDSLSVFSRLENRHHRYQLELVDMKEYLEQLLEEYKEEAEQKKITLLMEWTARNTQVKLDLQEMHRVFINLFENSVKYRTKERSVIKLILDERGTDLEIRVADDGPGVPEADLEHIFNSFYRGDASRTKPGSGSGLGLAIVKQIVEGHGGKICAYNDHGLVIVITLPLVRERLGGSRENGKGETGENEENTGG